MQKIQLVASRIISQVMSRGRNLNQVLESGLGAKGSWQAAERGAIQDLSYGTIRHYGQLKAILDILLHKPLADEAVEYLLLVAIYQLQYSKASEYTVVDQAVRAVHDIQPRVGGLVNALLRNFIRRRQTLLDAVFVQPEARFSYPRWWITALNEQYGGERATAILEAGNLHPPMTLRVNRRYGDVSAYQAQLTGLGMKSTALGPYALMMSKPVSVDRLPGFDSGKASVQDAGAQWAAQLLDVHDGMRVLDACSAPGGKTAHILEVADVEMVAVDKDDKRLTRVKDTLQRLNLVAELKTGDASIPATWWDGQRYDRILADVPCSASGVVKRHPDIKWLRRPEDIDNFAAQQLDILQALWPLLEPGGKLLYATCSVFDQENEGVIKRFLTGNSEALRLSLSLPDGSQGQLLPDEHHDGFFYALLQKRD